MGFDSLWLIFLFVLSHINMYLISKHEQCIYIVHCLISLSDQKTKQNIYASNTAVYLCIMIMLRFIAICVSKGILLTQIYHITDQGGKRKSISHSVLN